jgi:para-nitrobenzyl esterase
VIVDARTAAGAVRGNWEDGVAVFRGVPYAAPPVGPLRWASPRRPTPWTAPLAATEPGSPCAQLGGFPGDPPSDTEDCLYLNVTTPARTDGRRLPVMAWIHGDGFYQSSGGIYGAELLAAKGDVVVVTFNYRLGAFGSLAHPALDGPPARHPSGNFGLEDQQAALRWVRRNTAAFGGDPGNVTIFGESAGGASVCAHLAAPASGQLPPAQQRLSDQMIGAWTRFAHTGDPNGEGITAWPRFRGARGQVQSLAPGHGGIRPVDLGREHRCGFWQSLGQ